MMRRGLLMFVSLGMLGLLTGCHHCAGRCDCQVYPLEHGTPSPMTKPAPLAGPPVQTMEPVPAH